MAENCKDEQDAATRPNKEITIIPAHYIARNVASGKKL